jgi:hypothetical protein
MQSTLPSNHGNEITVSMHQQKNIQFGWKGSVRVDLITWSVRDTPLPDYSTPCVNTMGRIVYRPPIISLCSVSLLLYSITLALWPTGTMHWNGIIGHVLASGLQCDGWCCETLSTCSFYMRAKCNSPFSNHTHHFKSQELCGYWQSMARSICLLSYS